MARFYFDFENGGSTIDQDAAEFPNVDAAKQEAVATVGQCAMDRTRRGSEGRIIVVVRDDKGPVLEVTAIVETKPVEK
jgi:hypothetical protein